MVQSAPPNPQIPPPAEGVLQPPNRIAQFTERDGRLSPTAIRFLQQVYVSITGGDGILPSLASIQNDINAIQIDIDILQTDLDAAGIDIGTLQADLTAAEAAITVLQSTDVSLQTQINSLVTTANSLQAQIDALRRGGPFVYSIPTDGATITAAAAERRRVLDAASPLGSLTLVMPPSALDQDFYDLSTSQTITSMIISPNAGQTVNGSTFTFSANTGVAWLFRAATGTWFRRY